MSKILVAMSGGVDSSTTAFSLLNEGYEVAGITLSMGRECDKVSVEDAKSVANKLNIKHYVLDLKEKFNKNVVDYFVNSYKIGETPNPCAVCNRFIKFNEIINFMKEINFDFIATGHYANVFYKGEVYSLNKALCLKRDQSYFLSTLKYEFLQYIKFPLGNKNSKDEVRETAKSFDSEIAVKKDSQDICFISDGDYKNFLSTRISEKSGPIIHVNGEVLSDHNGISNYTIGQRKGLGISYKKPIFVVRFDSINNIIYVSDNEEDLMNDKVYIKDVNILCGIESKDYTIKLRSSHVGDSGKIKLIDNNMAEITLNNRSRAITRGQLACVYDNDKVICSGWIL